jgi:hypothetical protein
MSDKHDIRGKLEKDCNDKEKAMIAQWFIVSHPLNYPAIRAEARWTFCAKFGAKLFSGFL